MTYAPTPLLVARAWLAAIPALAGIQVDDRLLPVAEWAGDVFVVASIVGGGVDVYVPARTPVVQVDVRARPNAGAPYPPRNLADAYADEVFYATYRPASTGRYTMPLPGYGTAVIDSVTPDGEPTPEQDPTGLAWSRIDLTFTYRLA